MPEFLAVIWNTPRFGTSSVRMIEEEDLYQEDVRLVAKDGKLFYLPVTNRN